MPDPRLVSRAQRAATMLERAWERWRATQGLETEPMPPVSSYVGYSIEEPWGRPRVVFGVNAEDAERLAALLQESVGYGPDGLPRAADPGYRPPVPGAFAADRPAVPERGYPDLGYADRGYSDRGYDQSLLDDVRGRIPVQGWPPEFSDSREQLNGAGPSHPDEPQLPLDLGTARADEAAGDLLRPDEPGQVPDLKLPGELGLSDEFRAPGDVADQGGFPVGESLPGGQGFGPCGEGFGSGGEGLGPGGREVPPPGDLGPAAERGVSGLGAPYGVPYAGGAPYAGPPPAVPYTGEPYDPDGPYGPYGPAASYEGITGEAEAEAGGGDGRGGDGPRDLDARDGSGPGEDAPGTDLRAEDPRAGGEHAEDADGDAVHDDGAREEAARDETAREEAARDETAREEAAREEDLRGGHNPGAGHHRGGDADAASRGGPADMPLRQDAHDQDDRSGDPLTRDAEAAGREDPSSAGPGEEPPAAAGPASDAPAAPTAAAGRPADSVSRASIPDTMVAELAGWAAGELPGQAAARLASWATAGGAVARSRQQARLGGGGTAAERVS